MRITVKLDPDVAAAADRLKRTEGLSLSEALNRLVRAGLVNQGRRPRFKQRTADLGEMIDVSDVQDALDIAEGPMRR